MSANERAVLVALLAATGAKPDGAQLCALLIDQAARTMIEAPPEILAAIGGKAEPEDRLAGVALLSEICGQCRLCPRGQAPMEPGERRSFGLGPIGAARWR